MPSFQINFFHSKKKRSFFVTTTPAEKICLQEQWARAFYKNRLPFAIAEDPEFKKAMEMTRPGVGGKLLSERSLAGDLLDKEYEKIDEQMHSNLRVRVTYWEDIILKRQRLSSHIQLLNHQGKDVVLSQDGWSNIHREPIIASCVHVPGNTFLHDAVDVGDVTKDAEYCADLAKASIESAEEKYGCHVIGFVSDNENKMIRVRAILEEWRGKSFITYGCSAHYLNLVQNEATPPPIKNQLMEVQKYFRNHQRPAAQLKIKGGKIPQLTNETR